MAKVTRARAELVAKGHACSHCQEYTYRKLTVKPASASIKKELGAVWIAVKVCGVCDYQSEIGIQADGDIAYEG